jgi:AcrR family transcriptional regulator
MSRNAEPGRREAILAAAREIFQQQGYSRASMAQISNKSGVAHGTVYLYFKSKLAIADALCESYLEEVVNLLLKVITPPVDADVIRQTVHNVLAYAEVNADIIRLLDLRTNLGMEYTQPQADLKLQSVLRRAFRDGMKRGEIREYDPAVLAELVGGLIEWITKVSFVRASCDARRYEETTVRLLEYALLSMKTV